MPSPSVSVSVTAVSPTTSAGTSVAGSSTVAGSATGSDAGTGAGTTSTGTRIDSTEGGPITDIPAPGLRSPQVIVQSPALAPGLPAGGAITQLPLTLPLMTGACVCWARAALCTPPRLRLRLIVAMSRLFMDDPPARATVIVRTIPAVRIHSGPTPSLSMCNG